MKIAKILLLIIIFDLNCFSQEKPIYVLIPLKTAVKINFNGFKIGIEQRIYKNITAQFEIGKFPEGKSITYKPQLRIYRRIFKQNFSYIGLAYFYKHQETKYNDTIRLINNNGQFTGPRYTKDFIVNKYIHAITLNTGFISEERIFKQRFIFEFNIGVGLRYKKSSRYGLEQNEDLDLQEAVFIRPQNYQETNGAFKIYPELNLNLSLVIPLIK